jgi:hypothetical protein
MHVSGEIQQISFGAVLPHAFPYHEAEPGGLLLLGITELLFHPDGRSPGRR